MVASKEWLYIFSDHKQREWHGLRFGKRRLMSQENKHKNDVSNQFTEVCKELENIAHKIVGSVVGEAEDRSEELEERLKALGYL
jgi:hypothetical protein